MVIDPFRFARKGEQLEINLSLSAAGRLLGVIASRSEITLQLNGCRNENKRLVLDGRISGSVSVVCQVCLKPMPMPVEIDFVLFPVASEQQAERLQEDLEALLINDNLLELTELVSNELILSMPVAVSHFQIAGINCVEKDNFTTGSLTEDAQQEHFSSPFEILKSIKQK